jgi:serralysin
MASYTDVSPVSTYALTKNKYVDSLLFANAAMRNAWSTRADGKTQVSFSFAWANGADSKFAGNYGAEPLAFTHGAVPTAAMPQIADAFQAWANVANWPSRKSTKPARAPWATSASASPRR